MSLNFPLMAPRDDKATLWRRLFRLWVLMTGVWAFMGVWTTGLGCSLGAWCVGPTTLSAGEIAYEMLGLPFFFLVSGLLVRAMLLGIRALIRLALSASAARSSPPR